MIGTIRGKIREKAALIDPSHYGRSDTSAIGRWFWEIDKVLLLLITVLIAIGLIAVAAASPAADPANAVKRGQSGRGRRRVGRLAVIDEEDTLLLADALHAMRQAGVGSECDLNRWPTDTQFLHCSNRR
jgi:hypothetical protein